MHLFNPIWSKDGKYIVYTQEQAKGTDSNIFIADVATGKSTLLTPHQGEQLYFANDVSPVGIAKDMDYVLIHIECGKWVRQRWPSPRRHER